MAQHLRDSIRARFPPGDLDGLRRRGLGNVGRRAVDIGCACSAILLGPLTVSRTVPEFSLLPRIKPWARLSPLGHICIASRI